MLKSLILGSAIATLAVIDLGIGKLKPAIAADYAMSRSCLEAVNQAQSKIRSTGVEAVAIRVYEMSAESGYPDEKPLAIDFSMREWHDSRQNALVEAIMHSNKMLLALSTNVMQNCNEVSRVSFGVSPTDYVNSFLLIDGAVRPLTCLSEPVRGARMPWGYSYCP